MGRNYAGVGGIHHKERFAVPQSASARCNVQPISRSKLHPCSGSALRMTEIVSKYLVWPTTATIAE